MFSELRHLILRLFARAIFVDSLNWPVFEENRSIKTDSEKVLCHFIGNVNYLAWPDTQSTPVPAHAVLNKVLTHKFQFDILDF